MQPDLLAFTLFSIATSASPGPNNVMVSAGAANNGVRATIPHILGIAAGFALMLLVVGAGLAEPLATWSPLHAALRWVGGAWMLWLAWKIATASGGVDGARKPPLSFLGAALFQWVNPKAWMIAVATAATYTSPHGDLLRQVAVLAVITFIVCLPCVAAWALLGAGAGRLLVTPRRLRAFNVTMALLLVASLVPIVVG